MFEFKCGSDNGLQAVTVIP